MIDPTEDCGGCVDRKGNAGRNWHAKRGQDSCAKAREDVRLHSLASRRKRAEANGRTLGWIPGTPILLEEVEAL